MGTELPPRLGLVFSAGMFAVYSSALRMLHLHWTYLADQLHTVSDLERRDDGVAILQPNNDWPAKESFWYEQSVARYMLANYGWLSVWLRRRSGWLRKHQCQSGTQTWRIGVDPLDANEP